MLGVAISLLNQGTGRTGMNHRQRDIEFTPVPNCLLTARTCTSRIQVQNVGSEIMGSVTRVNLSHNNDTPYHTVSDCQGSLGSHPGPSGCIQGFHTDFGFGSEICKEWCRLCEEARSEAISEVS